MIWQHLFIKTNMEVSNLLGFLVLSLPIEILAESPQTETPIFILELFNQVSTTLAFYGWYILFACLILCVTWSKIRPRFYQWRQQADEDAYNKKIDPEKARAQLEAMDARYRKLQEDHDAKSRLYLEEEKKKEEQKRLQKIQDWENHQEGKGYRNKYHPKEENIPPPQTVTSKTKKKPLKSDDYNPLSSTSSGSGYRPSARGNTGG